MSQLCDANGMHTASGCCLVNEANRQIAIGHWFVFGA